MTAAVEHPATFSDAILASIADVLADHLVGRRFILDLFAGTGRVHELRSMLMGCDTIGVEIEPEWAAMHPDSYVGDATDLPFRDAMFDAVVTSPAYGNRMADNYAGDGTRRHTYRIALGRPLADNNSGGMQWGDAYRQLHLAAWAEAYRVVRPGGLLIVNVKDHVRAGRVPPVSAWHTYAACTAGWVWVDARTVAAPGQRFGANGELRLDHEWLLVFTRWH